MSDTLGRGVPGNVARSAQAGLLLAIAMLLSACAGGSAPSTFDLTAPKDGLARGKGRGLLVVAEPQALQAYDSDRIIVKTREGGIAALPNAQWADRLPRLMQTRLIQTFENASRITAIGRPGDRLVPAAQLNSEIRAFALDEATGEVVVEMSVKIVNDRSGRILAGQVFTSRVPSAGAVPSALDLAMQSVFRDIVRWASGRV